MKSSVFLGLTAILVCATPPASATDVGGPILTDTTWNHDGSPYIVTSSIMVADGATLVIEPNVAVRFEPGLALQVAGTLVARGTEESPILFTSDQPTPAPGDWSRIEFLDQAADATFDGSGTYQTGCVLEHVIVEYAGADDYGAVNVNRSAPFLSYCEIRQNRNSGIYVYSAPPLRIENCFVHDNQDSGIHFGYTGRNRLTGNVISGNVAADHGGGVWFDEYSGENTLTGNTISGNVAVAGGAGGLGFWWTSGTNTLIGNTVSENRAAYFGGGVLFSGAGFNTLRANTLSGNSAQYGGGIAFEFGVGNTLIDNTVTANTADIYGGGIHFRFSQDNTLSENEISANRATVYGGGGVYFNNSQGNTLTNNSITANSAGEEGGGIGCCTASSVTVVNCTFSGNLAPAGGAGILVCDSSSVTVENNIVWDGSSPEAPEIAIRSTASPATLAISYTDVQGGPAAISVETGCMLHWGGGNTDADPLFVNPNNGDFRLGAGSPCVDAGDNTAVPRDTADLDGDGCRTDRISLDLNGNYRFHDDPNTPDTGVGTFWYPGVVDMGAYEYGSDPNVPDGPCFGEMNCDGAIDNFDINPFVLALTDPPTYQATYPDCNFLNADVNDDGLVDNFDINAFIALLVGT